MFYPKGLLRLRRTPWQHGFLCGAEQWSHHHSWAGRAMVMLHGCRLQALSKPSLPAECGWAGVEAWHVGWRVMPGQAWFHQGLNFIWPSGKLLQACASISGGTV